MAASELPTNVSGSSERFGYSWERFSTLTPDQEEQFRRWTALIDPETGWMSARVLDVGCGAGRNSYWAQKYGADGGLAIDVDERSLGAACDNLRDFPGCEVKYQSIYDLDRENEFDIVFSIGVIHHLADPVLAVRKMKAAAKPGGRVLIWVYGRENMGVVVSLLGPLRKFLFSKLPLPLVSALAHVAASAVWLGLRVVPPKLEYFKLIKAFPYRHLHHIVFDQMLPKIANYWRKDEVLALMRDAGFSNVQIVHVNGMSWTAMAIKA